MDCSDAKEKIDLYVDDLLDDAEKQRLIWHASSCPECKKALDDAIKIKAALAGLKELEPPEGLAASAIKKAKRHFIPAWAYAAAAAAAAVALLFAFSPSLLPRMNGTADSEQKIMYSAASEEMAEDNGVSMEAAADASIAAPAAQSEFVAGAAASEVRTSETGADAYVSAFTFTREADFIEEMRSEGLTYYYKPSASPESADLVRIEVNDYSVRWVYSDGENSLVYEWYRTWTADDIANWREKTSILSDELAYSFNNIGEVYWSPIGRFNDSGAMETTDGSAINAYWTQDGAAFHAELPEAFVEGDILKTCKMDTVPIE
jgi:hypothetical protein